MYCKNCGKPVVKEADSCTACGFKIGYGTGYCEVCGTALDPGSSRCGVCGNECAAKGGGAARPSMHEDRIFKINTFRLCMSILSLILTVCVLFVPYYKARFEPEELEGVISEEQMAEAIERGYIEQSFSVFDELLLAYEAAFEGEEEFSLMGAFFVLEVFLFPLIALWMTLSLLYFTGKQVIEGIGLLTGRREAALLQYGEIKKTGKKEEKSNLLKMQTVYSLIGYIVGDVVYSAVMKDTIFGQNGYRYMFDIAGISGWSSIIVILFAAIIVLDLIIRRSTKRLRLDILREELGAA